MLHFFVIIYALLWYYSEEMADLFAKDIFVSLSSINI